MATEEAARLHMIPRKHRRSPGDGETEEASSPKRHRRDDHHRHRLEADTGEAGLVRGAVLPAPEHDDDCDTDLNIHANGLHTSQIARNPSQEHVYSAKSNDAATKLKDGLSNNLIAKEKIANNHELSNVFVGGKFYNVGKSPTLPKISVNLRISDNKKATSAPGLQEGIPKCRKLDIVGNEIVGHIAQKLKIPQLQKADIVGKDIVGQQPIDQKPELPQWRKPDIVGNDNVGQQPIGRKLGKENSMLIKKNTLHGNWEDEDGYYIYHFGEVLQDRYEITARRGKGVFSTVVHARDLKAQKDGHREVAIKIICNNIEKSGKREISILEKLANTDREEKQHCVRIISSFMHHNHLCIVLESLHMNLHEAIKKLGHGTGLKLTSVRAYSKQIFIALKHLRNSGVLHCDIKPDNILVNKDSNSLKLCDFGSAMSAENNEITPYLVSRFYRAPEIILGLPYDHPLDMWSAGCCLSELYTGKVLFDGSTNNDMLRLHMELKGPFPKKMLRKGAFTMEHFDQNLNFLARKKDPITKKVVNRLLVNIKPRGVGSAISICPGDDPKMVSSFKDLLEKIFVLDPKKRITVSEALSHPFITGK
uniref:non-specific serine/threonine protein kinase n=1 Tax=Leersia perrieri TaxID=77586 RepID=A0A0D9VY26_9ORYZ